MPGQTPQRNYPYPLGTEQIDVAGDIERLARAIDPDMQAMVASASLQQAALNSHGGDIANLQVRMTNQEARIGKVGQFGNPNWLPTVANTWTTYGCGSITLDRTYALLITVGVEIASNGGGYCRVVGGFNGTMHPDGEARCTQVANQTSWLTHQFDSVQGAGLLSFEIYGLTQNDGFMEFGLTSVVAVVQA